MTRKKTIPISIVGLSQSGKTSFTNRIVHNKFVEKTAVTTGIDIDYFSHNGLRFELFDMGGQLAFRNAFWQKRISTSQGVIFIIDGSDPNKFNEVQEWFDKVVEWAEELTTFMIVLNKSDLTEFISLVDMINKINFTNIITKSQSFRMFEVSCLTGENISSSLNWFTNQIMEQINLEDVKLSSVYLYTKNGLPLAHIKIDREDEEEVDEAGKASLVTGFFSALESFIQEILDDSLTMIETKNYKLVSAHRDGLVATIFVGVNDSSANSRVVVESIITESCYIAEELSFSPNSSHIKNDQYVALNTKLVEYLDNCLSEDGGLKNFTVRRVKL
ncbi:MAG: ADP-ribosylation factor-like protein [Candidatus Kariarchaeaceae archaeon]